MLSVQTKFLLFLPLCVIALCSAWGSEVPTSALEYQQATNTRIVVEENFLRFYTGGSERMTIDEHGNVGVGVVNPDYSLHINTGGSSQVRAELNSQFAKLGVNGAGGYLGVTDENGNLTVNIRGYGDVFFNSGNVGVGTTSPYSKLHIVSNNYLDFITLDRTSNDFIENVFYLTPSFDGNHNDQLRILAGNEMIACFEDTGNVGVGTTDPAYKLQVEGTVRATTFSASNPPNWPDYVFEDTYELNELQAVEKYIEENHHLPDVPSAAEVRKNGLDIVDMQAKLLQKIEELTLYVIELKKENKIQQKEIEKLKDQ
ncbi:hypothetical protein N7E81_19045 [Reichenbachiella carrageenanivorans]|uniref:Uncharacterized protein n=1 Tax=Reichenbachiella carrageenanivorans TaxID=2979869 RepID=A0ABY6D0K1_9BACT|nr:hypothetical protein [Reichenbachiella carrageenanivorans]UXX79449.1 hypothetical protein N7E81_19045 [Reichenbachiella carrageenanivorans]